VTYVKFVVGEMGLEYIFCPNFSAFILSIGIPPSLLSLRDNLDHAARSNVLGLQVTNFIS
jgi:hypothetical protein